MVIDGEGRPIPWQCVCRVDRDGMRDLLREVTDKIYTFLLKKGDPQFEAVCDDWRREILEWGKPRLDTALMKQVEVLGAADGKAGRPGPSHEGQDGP